MPRKVSGRIKVRIEENRFGHLEIEPVNKKYQALLAANNRGDTCAYIQVDYSQWEFLQRYPGARYGRALETHKHYGKVYECNSGAVFMMDLEDFEGINGDDSISRWLYERGKF